jgi:hypothetical protein
MTRTTVSKVRPMLHPGLDLIAPRATLIQPLHSHLEWVGDEERFARSGTSADTDDRMGMTGHCTGRALALTRIEDVGLV